MPDKLPVGAPGAGSAPAEEQLRDAGILLELELEDMQEIVPALVQSLVQTNKLPSSQAQLATEAVLRREAQASTALGQGLAVPHAKISELESPRIVIARLHTSINVGAPDGRPVRFVVLLLTGEDAHNLHLELLMGVARMMSDEVFVAEAHLAQNEAAFRRAIDTHLSRSALGGASPTKPLVEEDALSRTGRFAGGLRLDLKRRAPHYVSDLQDGFHPQAWAASIFLFFACVAPAVAFGGLMATLTGNEIGAIEMLVATAVGSVLYALLSGQPLTIVGGTGPLLVFTAVLYELCGQLEIAFLPTYAWVGLWTGFFTVVMALTDASALIRYCTRFTDEIFAVLISLIFIVQAVGKLKDNFTLGAVSEYSALLSIILAIGTLWIASGLRDFRRSRYLHPTLREFLADFGSIIAIGTMVALGDYFERGDMPILSVPDTLRPTADRPWLVHILDVPGWVIAATIIPALLCTVLVYLDQNITARLVNRRENRLRKGAGYHLDLLVVGGLLAVCSMLGLPWLVAATVRSLNHVHALSTHEESINASGQLQDTVVHVRENRVTGVLIGVFTGLSLLAFPWAARHGIHIPTAVLLGLFLYMGINSLGGNHMWERIKLFAMEPAHYPQTHYVRRVSTVRLHTFTAIQIACLAVLWVVKVSTAALFFPLVIALLVPLRLLLARFFNKDELRALDSEEEPEALGDSPTAGS